jgi:DHA3 family macrolide efflux protein-like MFS transporter
MSTPEPSTRAFAAIWVTQLISVIGSSSTAFVLGVWVYQTTGSVSQYSIIFAATVLPAVLVAPFAGVLVDRHDRKLLLIVSDCGAAAATALVAALWWLGSMLTWHVYLAAAVSASFGVLHSTAFSAMVPGLVPKKHLGRANGLIQLGRSVFVAAPLVAGALLLVVDLGGVIAMDLATFAVALAAVLGVKLPAGVRTPPRTEEGSSWGADLWHGAKLLTSLPGLPLLTAFAAAYYLVFALAAVLIRPLILSFTTPTVLGVLEFAGGMGMVAGSLAMSAWGGPSRRVRGVLLFAGLGGVALALHSLAPSPWLIAVVAPAFLCTMPIVTGTMMTLLHLKIPSASLGRVLATFGMLSGAAMPVGALLAGPLADGVFEPLLRPDGALAGSVGAVIGTGAGRGTALIFGLLGLVLVLLALAARATPRLLRLEEELPDAVPDQPTTAVN